MELIAKLDTVNEIVERKDFKSRKVWVTTDGQYPQTIEVEVAQDKIDLFNNIPPGSEVKLYINLRGRKWTNPEGKISVFNQLQCWKVEVLSAVTVEEKAKVKAILDEPDNDLPF